MSDDRDLFAPPTPPVRRPSCPCCGENKAVATDNHPAGRYTCGGCWTVFDGTDEEWRRWAKRREHRAKSLAGIRERNLAARGLA